jgi:NTP pyrophosphatase (non-canonical NTP hydrolase)
MNRIGYEDRKKVYEQAINLYGAEAQIHMVLEEMSELSKELCKSFRPGGTTLDNIADECADVTIMLEQLRIIFDMNDQVCEHMDEKIERLMGRIERDSA